MINLVICMGGIGLDGLKECGIEIEWKKDRVSWTTRVHSVGIYGVVGTDEVMRCRDKISKG